METEIEIEKEGIKVAITHNGYQWSSLRFYTLIELQEFVDRIDTFIVDQLFHEAFTTGKPMFDVEEIDMSSEFIYVKNLMDSLVEELRGLKSNERTEQDRKLAICITDCEKLIAYYNHYLMVETKE